MVPLVRTAQGEGYSNGQIMVSQYLVAVVVISLCCLFFSRRKVSLKDALKMMGVGVVAAGVSFFYYQALQLLPPALALTLLFQFVWMGMVVQAVRTRTVPKPSSVVVVLLVVFGAVLATGLLDEGVTIESLNLLGILFGFLSAVCYTAFLMLSSRVATTLPAINRSMFTALGSLLFSFALTPTYFSEPMLILDPIVSVALGVGGISMPIVLIALSAPKLPAGLTTVMASSELPSGVICAALFINEPVTLSIALGVIIVLAGIVASEAETLLSLRKKDQGADTPQRE